jgi:adenylate cyclase class 2
MNEITHEIETKVLDIKEEVIKKKLASLGAEKTQETRLVVDWYRIKGVKNGEDPWFLRIRSYSGEKHEVTWKAKSDILGTARKHKEINFFIQEPKKLSDLFEELGLEKYAHQEKDRISFSFKDWKFDLDQYPKMPAFLEIEGNSEKHIKEAMRLLGLENNRTWVDGERTLIENIYKLDWYNMNF